MTRIKDLKAYDRPREKAWRYGLESLEDYEVLAIIIGSGIKNKSAIQISKDILSEFKGIKGLGFSHLSTLENCDGLSKINALKLAAVFELSRRINNLKNDELEFVNNIDDIYQKYRYMEALDRENLILILLNKNNKILKEICLYKGTSDKTLISLKDIMVELLLGKASKFALIHNHPNGEYLPSDDDLIMTEILIEKAKEFDIKFYDHLIIFLGGYFSFKEHYFT